MSEPGSFERWMFALDQEPMGELRRRIQKGDRLDQVGKAPDKTFQESVLEVAARWGKAEHLRELLAGGADPDQMVEDGFTPLMAAMPPGNAECARALIEAGADLNRKETEAGFTAGHLAIRFHQMSCLDELLKAGADPKVKDREGRDWEAAALEWSQPDMVAMIRAHQEKKALGEAVRKVEPGAKVGRL